MKHRCDSLTHEILVTPPHQHLPPPKPLSLSQQRAKVIEELVTTETDYHAQMHITCEKLIPAMEEVYTLPVFPESNVVPAVAISTNVVQTCNYSTVMLENEMKLISIKNGTFWSIDQVLKLLLSCFSSADESLQTQCSVLLLWRSNFI